MTTVESKEESSDTDSGIILHSGPDSPTIQVKDLTTNTRALKLKQQSLEERLELCLLELRKLCIREAELTGKLPSDYPLMPDENPPRVRRRIGASFKLDEGLIHLDEQDSELQALETDLALQRKICEAARKLSLEGHLSKPQKKSRLQQCKREERKAKELQEAVFQHRIKSECNSPRVAVSNNRSNDPSMSDDSSLSDVVALDDDVDSPSPVPPPLVLSTLLPEEPHQLSSGTLQTSQQSPSQLGVQHERSPIQNSPWKESSLDLPYQKAPKPQSACSSRSSSPAGNQVPAESCRIPLSQFIKNTALHHNHSTSAPSTPELHVRRQYSQSFRVPKGKPSAAKECLSAEDNRGRARLPQRRCGPDLMLRSPEYSPLRPYQSSSEDSSSEHSSSSYVSSPGRVAPTEIPKLCPPPYGFHFHSSVSGKATGGQSQAGLLGYSEATAADGPLSPRRPDTGKCLLSSSPAAACSPQQKQRPDGALSPRRVPKPPPPYTRLVRTPSLKEYPNHSVRLMPREIVSEELRSWHQRNQLQKSTPTCADRQGPRSVKSPTSPRLPSFKQGSGKVILQRAADGTPVQWFIAEDAEIVSQV